MARRRGKRTSPKRIESIALLERKAAELAATNPAASAQLCQDAVSSHYLEVDWDLVIQLAIETKKGIALQKSLVSIEAEIRKQFPNG